MTVHLLIDKKTNKVVNRIEYDKVAPFTPPDDMIMIEAEGDIGWDWNGSEAINPNPPPPPPPPRPKTSSPIKKL